MERDGGHVGDEAWGGAGEGADGIIACGELFAIWKVTLLH